jgi:hypothetical protein
MKRTLFVSALLLASLQSQAQGICAGISTAGPATITEAAPEWSALPCIPDTIGGTGKGAGLRVSAAGMVPWLLCPNGTGWALRWGAATWADAAPIAAELPGALAATDKRTALAEIGRVHLSRDINEPELRALWCPHWAAMQASRPAAEVWVVANATSTANPPGTRPAFPWVGGVRGSVSNGRATQGTTCDRRIGVAPWHGVNGRADQVATCVKK